MMVLCCLRTRHLDMALEVVDWMKAAGSAIARADPAQFHAKPTSGWHRLANCPIRNSPRHRPSAFLFLEMLEAYAAAGDAGKVDRFTPTGSTILDRLPPQAVKIVRSLKK